MHLCENAYNVLVFCNKPLMCVCVWFLGAILLVFGVFGEYKVLDDRRERLMTLFVVGDILVYNSLLLLPPSLVMERTPCMKELVGSIVWVPCDETP